MMSPTTANLLRACCRRAAIVRPLQSWSTTSRAIKQTNTKCFSISSRLRLMEMSNFTETQLAVREAVTKLCSEFPDV
jgi:hypothetical protein